MNNSRFFRLVPGLLRGLATAGMTLVPLPTYAQEGIIEASDTGDTALLLAASLFILLAALPGLALFYAGRARTGATALLTQTAAVAAAVSLAWIVAGYTLAFGQATNGWVGGGGAWMLMNLGNVRAGLTIPESAFALFQIAFVVLAAAIVPGAWAGRARFGWVVLFMAAWSLSLAPVMHWLWGGGWLSAAFGTIDFAGGLAVELAAGTTALVTALLMGKGKDFAMARPQEPAPMLALYGALMAWIGWMALCGGSAFAANDDAASAMISAHAAGCAGVLARLALDRLQKEAVTAGSLSCGLVAGLAGIAPAALYISPGGAMAIGAMAALLSALTADLLRRIGVDDRLDVFALFAVPGAVGALLLAPFMAAPLGGTGYAEGMDALSQLAAQGIGVVAVFAWSAIVGTILALTASVIIPMRVTERVEAAEFDRPGLTGL